MREKVIIGVLLKNVQVEIIKLQRNVLHLNFSLNYGNLKLRIPPTFGIKSENCGKKNLGQIIQIWNCNMVKFKNSYPLFALKLIIRLHFPEVRV